MKRKMLGAVSVVITAAALSMPSQAAAQDVHLNLTCGSTLQECVENVIDTAFDETADALQLTMDTIEGVCDWATNNGCSF